MEHIQLKKKINCICEGGISLCFTQKSLKCLTTTSLIACYFIKHQH